MSIKVDNLENLFWDNGSYRVPNTFPKLATGKFFNKTPVMTSAVSGWVILEGEWNYCEWEDELYFLKKENLISSKKKKYRYILIKDHFCNILKNKGNVFAQGTLVNTSLDKVKGDDFNFARAVINNFGKRLLYPLRQQNFDWKHHLVPVLPTKVFPNRTVINNDTFSHIIRRLENIDLQLRDYSPSKPENNALTLFLRLPKATVKADDWRNTIIQKIKDLISNLSDENIVLGKVTASRFNRTPLQNKWCITYRDGGITSYQEREDFKQVSQLDFSGLIDIRCVKFTDTVTDRPFVPRNFKFVIDDSAIQNADDISPEIFKLERRVRVSFSNLYSTRAIFKSGDIFYSWFLETNNNLFHPQKIFIKNNSPLVVKSDKKKENVRPVRTGEEFRSVYLYYCDNFNFFFKFASNLQTIDQRNKDRKNYPISTQLLDIKSPSNNAVSLPRLSAQVPNIEVIDIEKLESYVSYYPFFTGLKDKQESMPFGWLVGQFSRLIEGQYDKFHSAHPYYVLQRFKSLDRIKGLKPVVQQLIQNKEFFDEETESSTYSRDRIQTIDWFDYYPKRFIENTKELDFQIGEKLLFYTWGPLSYTFFQPADKEYIYGCYYLDRLSPNFIKNVDTVNYSARYVYLYDIWNNTALNTKGKSWIKKPYQNWKDYQFKTVTPHFFSSDVSGYKAFLRDHIFKNTKSFFEIEENVSLPNFIEKGDYFWTDLDYYWTDVSIASTFPKKDGSFFQLNPSFLSLQHNEVVVYNDVINGKLIIGKVQKIPLEVILPDGQFIASDVGQAESNLNVLKYNAYRLYNIAKPQPDTEFSTSFNDFKSLISELKKSANLFYSDWFDFKFDEVKGEDFLFDLVGTRFYLYLDVELRVHLIFKDKDAVQDAGALVYSIDVEDNKEHFLPVAMVNQRATLSFYGIKIDLPVKIFEKKALITIFSEIAKESNSPVESARIEIKHSLGTSYLRVDIPKPLIRKQLAEGDAYTIEALENSIRRSYDDYRLQKEAQDLEFQAIFNQLEDQKWETAQLRKENFYKNLFTGIGQITSFATGLTSSGLLGNIVSNATNLSNLIPRVEQPSPHAITVANPPTLPLVSTFGQDVTRDPYTGQFKSIKGALALTPSFATMANEEGIVFSDNWKWKKYDNAGFIRVGDFRVRAKATGPSLLASALGQGISQMGTTVTSYMFNNERFDRQDLQTARDIKLATQQKLLQSYELDLSFDRMRAGASLQLRKIFSFQNFNSTSSYERNLQLDKQELPKLKTPIYLELWVPSAEQLDYLQSFHDKFGVDCRITHQTLYIRDGMELGIFKFEEPTVVNLSDFIDNELIRVKLEQGIKVETWNEVEVHPDLVPVDPRVLKLQNELKKLELQEGVLLEKVKQKEEEVSQLWEQLREVTKNRDSLNENLQLVKGEVEGLNNILSQEQSKVREKDLLISSNKEELVRLNKEIKDAGDRYHELSESYRTKEKEADDQKVLAALYLGQKTQLSREKASLERKNAKLESQVTEINDSLRKKQEAFDELNNQSKECKEELTRTKSEVDTQKLQIDKQLEQIKQLESAPKEEKELTDNDLKILVKHIFTADVISKTTHLWNSVNLLITKDSQNGLIYLQYEQDVFCWVVTKLKVWAYDGYKAFSISRRTDNKLDQLDNDREYWRTLRSGYFTRNITHWARPQGVNALLDWVYVGNYNINITENLRWPFFVVKPKSDDDLVRNAKGKIYYDKENREYTYVPTDVPVNNYGDYKRTLRMMFSPN